jgi:two-component system, cell cycle sensor histidine kinase and response regulator CckA
MFQDHYDKKADPVQAIAGNGNNALSLLDIFPEPCILIDTAGLIFASNISFAARFSRRPEECMGLNVFELLSHDLLIPETAELRRKKLEEVVRTGMQLTFEDDHDGVYHRHTIYPLRSIAGEIQHLFIIAQDITEIKRSEQAGEYEQAFRKALIDVIPGIFYLIDADARFAGWNSYLRDEIVGKPECEMAGVNALESIHPDDWPTIQSKMLNILERGVEERTEVRAFRRGGPEIIWFLMTAKKIMLNETPFLIGIGIDITKRKKAETELQKLNRALLAISNCNQVLLHAHDETELLRKICRTIVDVGGYRMAWVGYAEDNQIKGVRPMAQAGFADGYLETMMITWADIDRGRGPVGTAIRTGQPCSVSDVRSDQQFLPWRMEAEARGYVSVLSLPLKSGNRAFGALTIYSVVPDAFNNAEEMKLLTALADNLAYGITMLQTRKAHEEAENALRQSEARYRNLFQNHHTVMLIIDPGSGMIVEANPAALSFYGMDHHELCRKNISQINVLAEEEVTIKREGGYNQESNCSRHCRADGSVRDVEVFSAPLVIEGKTLLYFVVHDVTERLRHESLSAFRQYLLKMAESHSVEALLRLTLDEAEKRTGSSIGFCYLLGENHATSLQVSSTNVHRNMSKSAQQVTHPYHKDAELWADVVNGQVAVITNEYKRGERQIHLPGNHPEITRTLVVPVLQGEKVVGIFWVGNKPDAYVDDDIQLVRTTADIAWDIVSRKLAEQTQQDMQSALTQLQKMELIGQLAGGIAHDFNNMLGVIIGNIEMAMEHTAAHEEPLQYNLKNILNAATRSANLTRQLLAFARKQPVMPLVLELNTMVETMLAVLRRLIGENITIVWIPDTSRTLVNVDPSQIDQILVNLCINARDAIAGIGKITIEIGRLCEKKTVVPPLHPCQIAGDYVTLSVTDNGCGIEKEHLPHIFEPFFTTKEPGKGTGLGLSTVYGIVKQNNGCLDYTSEPGKGSTFKIHLPRHRSGYGDPDEDEQAPSESKQGKGTILLVENEHDILILCKAALEEAGYTILPAVTPRDAIQIALQHKGEIDMLLTDVVMPDMNGCDLAKELLSVTPDLKTLYMSGYSSDIISRHGVIADGVNFIQKPFFLNALTMMVHNILNPG